MANAHDILNKTRWTSASIREVIDNTIAAFPIEQISISGPAMPINPKMALTLALAVNELGTNALKYGALSTPEGKVTDRMGAAAGCRGRKTVGLALA